MSKPQRWILCNKVNRPIYFLSFSGLAFFRSILTCVGAKNNLKNLSSYIRSNRITRECEHLYQKAGVKRGRITLKELAIFQNLPEFENYRFNVYSSATFGKRVWRGSNKNAKFNICLLIHGGHMHPILRQKFTLESCFKKFHGFKVMCLQFD